MTHAKDRNCGRPLLLGLMVLIVLSFAPPLSATFTGTPQLIGVPAVDVRIFGSLLISPSGSTGLNSNCMTPGVEGNLNLSFRSLSKNVAERRYALGCDRSCGFKEEK